MKKVFSVLAVLTILLVACAFTGCPDQTKPIEVIARDGVAAAKGFIESEQKQHLEECQAAPTKPVCIAINKAIASQNLVIDAIEVYCASPEFATGTKPCVPHPNAETQLRESLQLLNDVVKQIKTLTAGVRPGPDDPIVLNAGVGFLTLLDMALAILSGLLVSLGSNPKFVGVVASIEQAVSSLSKAREEVVTKDNLEALRTEPKW
ncbi:MAG TPA: hypothetical protein VN622_10995 [Clostridia bacterium]|nr:hypothetical protein [Clostridia bacterium]